MTDVRKIGIASGIPNSGTGTVSTLDTLAAVQFGSLTQLVRPNNTTAYVALDSISNTSVIGSVTALVATISDTIDDPVSVEAVLVKSSDTGIGGTSLRAYLFNANPTGTTGVQAGDNSPWSNKQAGLVGTLAGKLLLCNDGAVGRLVPEYGQTIKTTPTSGAQTLYIQYQTIDGFTPSAGNSTVDGTIIATQGRA
jgi:hypothetical protein